METKQEQAARVKAKGGGLGDMPGVGPLPKKPLVKVRLVGEDGNAFAIMGRVTRELKRAGFTKEVEDYRKRATAGDYNNLLSVTLRYADDAADEDDEEDCCGTCGEPTGGRGGLCAGCAEEEEDGDEE
jgi:hypothetical protein